MWVMFVCVMGGGAVRNNMMKVVGYIDIINLILKCSECNFIRLEIAQRECSKKGSNLIPCKGFEGPLVLKSVIQKLDWSKYKSQIYKNNMSDLFILLILISKKNYLKSINPNISLFTKYLFCYLRIQYLLISSIFI